MKVLCQYKSKTIHGEEVNVIEVLVDCKKEAKQIRKNLNEFYKCVVEMNIDYYIIYDTFTERECRSDGYRVSFSIFPNRLLKNS